jgi:Mn-dependent DtxR family transcriptional regulator
VKHGEESMVENGFYTVRGYELLHSHSRTLTPAMEDYLEMIARHDDADLRTGALAARLNVSASSATKMLQRLAALGLVMHRRYGAAALTDAGRELGAYLLLRHRTVERFLRDIGIRGDLLRETELVEHDISAETLAHMDMLSRFLERCPDVRERLEAFRGGEENAAPGG